MKARTSEIKAKINITYKIGFREIGHVPTNTDRRVIVGWICSSEICSKAVIKATKAEAVMSYYNEL